MIDPDVKLGRNARIFNPDQVNIFGCEIGDDSFIGPFVEITRGVVIGKRCKIESHSFICTDVMVEDDVFIGHGVMFTNDLYPRTDRQVVFPKTVVMPFASIGSGATILAGVTIGRHAIVNRNHFETAEPSHQDGLPGSRLTRIQDSDAAMQVQQDAVEIA